MVVEVGQGMEGHWGKNWETCKLTKTIKNKNKKHKEYKQYTVWL